MTKPVKIILVTAEHHPYHKMWMRIAEKVAKKLEATLEVRKEDYLFVVEHGETDEYGMAGLPQIIAQYPDGTYKPLLSQLPLNEKYKPDEDKAVEEAVKKALEQQ